MYRDDIGNERTSFVVPPQAGTQASAIPGFFRVRNTSPELSKGSCRGGLDPGLRRDDKEGDKWIISQPMRAGDRESRSKSGVVVSA